MNAKQLKAIRWHKKCMIDAMKAEGIILCEIDVTLDNIIDEIDSRRVHLADKKREESYRDGFVDGQFSGYCDGWDKAIEHVSLNGV